jgi:hypothetical protein
MRHRVVSYVRTTLVGDDSVVAMLRGLPDAVDREMAKKFFDTLEIDTAGAPVTPNIAP